MRDFLMKVLRPKAVEAVFQYQDGQSATVKTTLTFYTVKGM